PRNLRQVDLPVDPARRQLPGAAGLGQDLGRAQQRLARDAAEVGALPAHQALLDHGQAQAGAGQLGGHGLAARPGADADDVELAVIHSSDATPDRSGSHGAGPDLLAAPSFFLVTVMSL